MTFQKAMICISALVLLALVCHAATDANSDDNGATAHGISGDASGDDTASRSDFDGDGTIGLSDFLIFAGAFGSRQGDERYEARFDLDGDGAIGLSDFLIFVQHFGSQVPPTGGGGGTGIVDIPDMNLRAVIADSLGKASGAPITVAEMRRLTDLEAEFAGIHDLEGLQFATNLTYLDLSANSNIPDLSLLAGLTNLTHLYLRQNNISDVSPLAGLTNLIILDLRQNNISDVSPLAGLTNLKHLALTDNLLTASSINDHIPALQARGVEVEFDPKPAVITDDPTPVTIPDAKLRAAIAAALGKSSGAPITRGDMTTLARLKASEAGISELTDLEFATNLRELTLNFNNISDISPLSDLTELKRLELWSNKVTDISPLRGLTNLTYLDLDENNIAEISPLSGLTNLTKLYLYDNNIAEISPLSGLTNLTLLSLPDNNISDISPLSGLTNLTELTHGGNNISDISPLSGLTNLTRLALESNNIQDISALSNLTNLTYLDLDQNNISDISALAGLTSLKWLYLEHNRVTEISPLRGLTNLTELELRWNFLNDSSLDDHIPALESRGVTVFFTRFRTGNFDIELVFLDDFDEKQKDALRLVAKRWMSVITDDLQEYEFAQGWLGQCGDHSFEIPAGERIDDLRIYMTTFEGGGPEGGGPVGRGGPSLLRDGSHLPVVGCMGFDLENANLLITGLHEVGHVLGFGSIWDDLGFYQNPPDGDQHFSGPLAIAAFDDAGGSGYSGKKVPLNDPAHWRGDVFQRGELMLPWGGGALSAITVQSLADLGYGVDVSQADPYTLPHAAAKVSAKIAVSALTVPRFDANVFRPDVDTLTGANLYRQASTEGIRSLRSADGRNGHLESAERIWGRGTTFDLPDGRQIWGTDSPSFAGPRLTCGAGLVNEPIYVIDPQGRIVRTINR